MDIQKKTFFLKAYVYNEILVCMYLFLFVLETNNHIIMELHLLNEWEVGLDLGGCLCPYGNNAVVF